MEIGGTITPNGTPLITAEEMQEGIMDVLDDNGDLSTVDEMFKMYEQYQSQLAELQAHMEAQQQQKEAQNLINANNEQTALINQMMQGRENIMRNGISEENSKEG